MEALINKIKSDQVESRKARDSIKSSLLTTLIGEAEVVGKNKRNGAPTDSEVLALIKKFIDGVNQTIAYIMFDDSVDRMSVLNTEKAILESYMPKQLSYDEIKSELLREFNTELADGKTKGLMMKHLKDKFLGQYDGKVAAEVADQIIKEA